MDRDKFRDVAQQMRDTFMALDLLDLRDFPDDEYDALADAATSVISNHGSVDEAIDRVTAMLHASWGTTLSRTNLKRLRDALSAAATLSD